MRVTDGKELVLAMARAHRDRLIPKKNRFSANIIGGAGIGKTKVIWQCATELNMAYINIRAGQLEPGDLLGIPKIEEREGKSVTIYAAPSYLPQLNREGKFDVSSLGDLVLNRDEIDVEQVQGAILHLDEITRVAGDDTKQAIFQLPEQYRIHTYEVPEGCFIISSHNPSGGHYQGNHMEQERAFMDRFVHMIWEPEVEDWLIFAQKKNFDPRILSFIEADRDALFEKEEILLSDYAIYRSPRAWEMLDSLLRFVPLPKNDVLLTELFSGVIGSSFASTFSSHLKKKIEPVISPQAIITNYASVRSSIEQAVAERNISYLHTVLERLQHALTQPAVIDDWKLADNMENLEQFLSDLPKETRVLFLRFITCQPAISELITEFSPTIIELLSEDTAFLRTEEHP